MALNRVSVFTDGSVDGTGGLALGPAKNAARHCGGRAGCERSEDTLADTLNSLVAGCREPRHLGQVASESKFLVNAVFEQSFGTLGEARGATRELG
jgi:hypothetical protein